MKKILRTILMWLGFVEVESPKVVVEPEPEPLTTILKHPDKEPPRSRKPKMRGYDGTMYGPFRSRQGG